MTLIVRIRRIGKSLYFTIPAAYRSVFKIDENDVYAIDMTSEKIVLTKIASGIKEGLK